MKNIKDYLFITILLLLLVLTPINIFINGQTDVLLSEYRPVNQISRFTLSEWFSTDFQNDFEAGLLDQSFERDLLMKMYTTYTYTLTYLANGLNIDNKYVPIRDVVRINGYFSEPPLKASDLDLYKYKGRISNYNDTSAFLESVNIPLYIYKNLYVNETNWFDEYNSYNYGQDVWNLYSNNIDDYAIVNQLKIKDFSEYMNIAYKTDHHYTAYGSHRYYEDIIATLSENFKLGEPYKYEEPICFNDYFVKYRGSYARRTAFFSGGYDQLCDVDYNLNEYLLYSDGQRIETISTLEKYLETKGAHVMDSDHYRVLHGGVNSGTLHYLFEENELNALFLIDSNIVPIADVLASHFNNTYYVDTRIEDYFKLEDFVEEHDIDFVFVALMYKNYYDNDGYYINIR